MLNKVSTSSSSNNQENVVRNRSNAVNNNKAAQHLFDQDALAAGPPIKPPTQTNNRRRSSISENDFPQNITQASKSGALKGLAGLTPAGKSSLLSSNKPLIPAPPIHGSRDGQAAMGWALHILSQPKNLLSNPRREFVNNWDELIYFLIVAEHAIPDLASLDDDQRSILKSNLDSKWMLNFIGAAYSDAFKGSAECQKVAAKLIQLRKSLGIERPVPIVASEEIKAKNFEVLTRLSAAFKIPADFHAGIKFADSGVDKRNLCLLFQSLLNPNLRDADAIIYHLVIILQIGGMPILKNLNKGGWQKLLSDFTPAQQQIIANNLFSPNIGALLKNLTTSNLSVDPKVFSNYPEEENFMVGYNLANQMGIFQSLQETLVNLRMSLQQVEIKKCDPKDDYAYHRLLIAIGSSYGITKGRGQLTPEAIKQISKILSAPKTEDSAVEVKIVNDRPINVCVAFYKDCVRAGLDSRGTHIRLLNEDGTADYLIGFISDVHRKFFLAMGTSSQIANLNRSLLPNLDPPMSQSQIDELFKISKEVALQWNPETNPDEYIDNLVPRLIDYSIRKFNVFYNDSDLDVIDIIQNANSSCGVRYVTNTDGVSDYLFTTTTEKERALFLAAGNSISNKSVDEYFSKLETVLTVSSPTRLQQNQVSSSERKTALSIIKNALRRSLPPDRITALGVRIKQLNEAFLKIEIALTTSSPLLGSVTDDWLPFLTEIETIIISSFQGSSSQQTDLEEALSTVKELLSQRSRQNFPDYPPLLSAILAKIFPINLDSFDPPISIRQIHELLLICRATATEFNPTKNPNGYLNALTKSLVTYGLQKVYNAYGMKSFEASQNANQLVLADVLKSFLADPFLSPLRTGTNRMGAQPGGSDTGKILEYTHSKTGTGGFSITINHSKPLTQVRDIYRNDYPANSNKSSLMFTAKVNMLANGTVEIDATPGTADYEYHLETNPTHARLLYRLRSNNNEDISSTIQMLMSVPADDLKSALNDTAYSEKGQYFQKIKAKLESDEFKDLRLALRFFILLKEPISEKLLPTPEEYFSLRSNYTALHNHFKLDLKEENKLALKLSSQDVRKILHPLIKGLFADVSFEFQPITTTHRSAIRKVFRSTSQFPGQLASNPKPMVHSEFANRGRKEVGVSFVDENSGVTHLGEEEDQIQAVQEFVSNQILGHNNQDTLTSRKWIWIITSLVSQNFMKAVFAAAEKNPDEVPMIIHNNDKLLFQTGNKTVQVKVHNQSLIMTFSCLAHPQSLVSATTFHTVNFNPDPEKTYIKIKLHVSVPTNTGMDPEIKDIAIQKDGYCAYRLEEAVTPVELEEKGGEEDES